MLDLFAGAGGLTEGFVAAGFRPCFAVESERSAAATYAARFGDHIYAGSIEQVREFPEVEVIVGGPPCQGFSPLGRNGRSDFRAELNELWQHYVRAVTLVRPAVFLIENVPQFLTSAQFQDFLERMRKSRSLRDYSVEHRVLNAVDFGVPQRRRRGIIFGSRVGPVIWPQPSHGLKAIPPMRLATVRDAIGDLPVTPTDRGLHFGRNPTPRSIERYKAVPPGGNRFDLAANRPDLLSPCWARKKSGTTDVFGRLLWDEPAVTIRTEFYKPEKGRYLHPEAHRPITHLEAARLQTFPDDYPFQGSKVEIARQIGNAVPPRLAQALAMAVREMLGVKTSRAS